MPKIFITGANGFLGSNLVRHFLNNVNEVTAVVRSGGQTDNLSDLECQVIEYDGSISSLQVGMNAESIVIHTASYYVAEHNEDDLPKLIKSNLQYGLNLLEAMRISGAKKIINIGTAWQGYKGEERRPVNLYAATKQAFEDFIAYYCDAENFSSISLRLNDTYGEEDKRMKLVKLLINAGITQTSLNMSAGDQKVNLSHISDVCCAIEAAIGDLPKPNYHAIYNLINKDEYSLKELVKIIEDELHMTIPVNFGVREYRTREVMEPLKSHELIYFKPVVGIRAGIRRMHYRLGVEGL
jgi:CDP-paratose synthetase